MRPCPGIIGVVMAGLSRLEHLAEAPLLGCAFAAAVVGTLTFGALKAGAQDASPFGTQAVSK